MKRLLLSLFFLVLVGAVAGGLVWFNLVLKPQKIGEFFASRGRPTVTVSTIEVAAQTWQPGIEAIGTVLARQGVDLAVRTAGIVNDIAFSANEKVEAGALLVQLDDELEQADLIAAEANVQRDSQALERASKLTDRGINSTSTLDNAKAALDASRSQLERVKAQIAQKRTLAPFSGTIGIPRIDRGQYVSPGTMIATLQDLERMKVDFTVPEQQLGALSIGQPLRLGLTEDTLDYRGNIVGIDPKIDPSSRLVKVQAEVDNEDGALRPGQFAYVRLELPQEDDVIALPQTAVTQSLYGTYVYVVRPSAAAGATAETGDQAEGLVAQQVFVKTGRRFGGRIEVLDGVKVGEKVVTAGQNKLSAGSPVEIDNSIDPSSADSPGAAASDDAEPAAAGAGAAKPAGAGNAGAAAKAGEPS